MAPLAAAATVTASPVPHPGEWPADGTAADPSPQAAAGERASTRRRRQTRLPAPVRLAALGVVTVVLGAATIGIQVWDRSQWVAERYPAEAVQDGATGQPMTMAGMEWTVEVSRMPRRPDDKPGRVMLQITARFTPGDQKSIEDFQPPTFELRDTAGREWATVSSTGSTPIRSDMRVGKSEKLTAYGVVPAELADTVQVALVYRTPDGEEVLRFNR